MSRPLDQIVTPLDPERAMTATLQRWLPTYLAHLARQEELDPAKVGTPRSWQTSNETVGRWPEDQLPAIYAVAQGIVDEPAQDGDGWIRATFRVHVAAVVGSSDRESTDRLSKLYAAAIYAAVSQNRSLGGTVSTTQWRGGSWDVIPGDKRRTLAGCELFFDITINETVNAHAGLDEPPPGTPPQDPGNWPTFETVDATIDPQEIT